MSLRLRLVLAVVLTTVPLVAGLAWLLRDLERAAIENGLRDLVVARMLSGDRERCEESPSTFGGPVFRRSPSRRSNQGRPRATRAGVRRGRFRVPPIEIWAYGDDFQSANSQAPAFPAALAERLRGGDRLASWWRAPEPRDAPPPDEDLDPRPPAERLDLALRMDWDEGPCAVLLVRHRRARTPSGPFDLHWSAFAVGGVGLLAMLLAAGPPVRRIRRLTEEVRRSAEERYAHPVEVRGRDEIARLAAAFNAAAAEIRSQLERVERREETLRSFLGNTTHDVMVPLTVLQGHLAALRQKSEASKPPDPELLVAALDETQYIASLLHNLGAMAKLEAEDAELRRDPVDLGALVERAVARHAPLARARGIEINCAVPEAAVVVAGDVTLLEQAVSNVIHNAVRYNEPGGHVAAVLDAEPSGRFSLRVVDDGPGIPPEELARLPERRFRGEAARTRHPDGHGLGLHIARDVAARHGLELRLRRSEYGGLEVELSGPA